MARVGVCEDDPSIRRVLGEGLRLHGHDALMAHDGGEALRLFRADASIDVLVLDIGLPDADGRDLITALRSAGQQAPVLFLTALDALHDRLSGFAAGADDYLPKPFAVAELVVRVEALARRGRPGSRASDDSPPGREPDLQLDPSRHAVLCGPREALLTPTEFRLLAAVSSRRGEVVRRQAVVAAAWPPGAQVSDNTVDSYATRIRRKLEQIGSPVQLRSVRGVGYQLR